MKVSSNTTQKISVLLADDHQMLLDLWIYILTRDGRFHICGKATNGKMAVDMAKSKRPDIVVLDISMEPLDGFETTRLIRKFSPVSKIIGISMYVLPAFAKKMKALGAMGYVTKSSPADELVKAIIEVYNNRPYLCRQIKNLMKEGEELITEKSNNHTSLTRREIEVIRLIVKGLTSNEIADSLSLSPKTINIHRNNIFRKLQVKNISTLITKSQTLGLW